MQTCGGLFYCFPLYSSALKHVWGLSQSQVQPGWCAGAAVLALGTITDNTGSRGMSILLSIIIPLQHQCTCEMHTWANTNSNVDP